MEREHRVTQEDKEVDQHLTPEPEVYPRTRQTRLVVQF